MSDDRSQARPEQDSTVEREDPLADRLDDLDPEDLGEDVSGGGMRQKATMSSVQG
jgi:hypothetical protein